MKHFSLLLPLLKQPELWKWNNGSHLSISLKKNNKFRIFIGSGFLFYELIPEEGKVKRFSFLQGLKSRPLINQIEAGLEEKDLFDLLQ